MRVERVLKGANSEFVFVTGINEENFGVFDEGIPIFGFNVLAHFFRRIYTGDTDGDYFIFKVDFHLSEWVIGAVGFLKREV